MDLTARYSITHFTHWAAGTAAVSFATLYLLNRGVSAGMAGTLLALSGLLSCVTQPFLAALADRARNFILVKILVVMSVICCVNFALQIVPGIPVWMAGIFYMIGLWASDAMVPLLNALSVAYEKAGYIVNYGLGRGIGAVASGISTVVVGFLIARLGTTWMILFLLFFRVLGIFTLIGYPALLKSEGQSEKNKNCEKQIAEISGNINSGEYIRISEDAENGAQGKKTQKEKDSSIGSFFVNYKWYCLSLLAVLFLGMFHAMTENYMIAIMERLGGDSSNVGIAIGIASMVAFPVLCVYSQIRKHLKDTTVLKIAAVSFLIKAVAFYFARSVAMIYAIQLIQMTSYAFLAPAQVYYAEEKVQGKDMVKGQAFITAAYAFGCSAGNFTGGQLLSLGVDKILLAGIGMAGLGTVIMFGTVNRLDSKLKSRSN